MAAESPLLIHEQCGVILYEIKDSTDLFYCIATLPCDDRMLNFLRMCLLGVSGTIWLKRLYIIYLYEGFNQLVAINMTKFIGHHTWFTQGSIQAALVAGKTNSNRNTESYIRLHTVSWHTQTYLFKLSHPLKREQVQTRPSVNVLGEGLV